LIDHDELRHDPLMAALAGKLEARREDCAPVAGKSTLNLVPPCRWYPIGETRALVYLWRGSPDVPPRGLRVRLFRRR